jgi:hypothetical protein
MMGIILSKIHSRCSNSSMFVEFFKKLIILSLKLIKYTLKKKKKCDVHTLPTKLIAK